MKNGNGWLKLREWIQQEGMATSMKLLTLTAHLVDGEDVHEELIRALARLDTLTEILNKWSEIHNISAPLDTEKKE